MKAQQETAVSEPQTMGNILGIPDNMQGMSQGISQGMSGMPMQGMSMQGMPMQGMQMQGMPQGVQSEACLCGMPAMTAPNP